MDKIKIGVVTTSDRASQGIYEDISGVAIMDTINKSNLFTGISEKSLEYYASR